MITVVSHVFSQVRIDEDGDHPVLRSFLPFRVGVVIWGDIDFGRWYGAKNFKTSLVYICVLH